MKRISIVTLMAALVLLSGCNKDNEFNNSVDIDINNSSEVPIKLGTYTGSTSATTRASIESLDEMVGNDEHRVGVFCLAARKTDIKSAQSASDVDWMYPIDPPTEDGDFGKDYSTTTHRRYWDNLCCEVTKEAGSGFRLEPVQKDDENYKPYYSYYPISSVYGYDFYSYYPYQPEEDEFGNRRVSCSTNSVCVDFDINGTQDIIWGKSVDVTRADLVKEGITVSELLNTLTKSYYSARFFRKNPKKENAVPIVLKHKLARFQFYVSPGPDDESAESPTYNDTKGLYLKEIKVLQVPNKLRLVVAGTENGKNAGTLYAKANSKKEDFCVFEPGDDGSVAGDEPIRLTEVDENGVATPVTTAVGDYMMLPAGVSQYFLSIKLVDETGREYPSEKVAFGFNEGNFAEGMSYNVRLQVSGIKFINISAELDPWENGDEMDLVEFN